MTEFTDRWVVPWLAFLAEWSLRWGLVLGVLALWLALKPPRRAAIRYLLCMVGLTVGLLLPITPRWWVATVAWPSRRGDRAAQSPARPLVARIDPRDNGVRVVPDADSLGLRSAAAPRSLSVASVGSGTRGRSERESLGAWRIAALAVVGVWLSGVVMLSIRVVGGWLLLKKLKSRASPGNESTWRLIEECRRTVGLSRSVALALHPAVGSPVAIGGRRALILVPPDWENWSESDRRACSLHELTHLAHRDDRIKLIQEFVAVPFFFHPLVRWLLSRLDHERELLCDENVVALGADPLRYARLLFDLAQRPGRLLPAAVVFRPGWLPFFDRRTVAVRIDQLLEDDVMRSLSPLPTRRLLILGVVVFAFALVLGGLRVRAVEPRLKQNNVSAPQAAKAPSTATVARKIE